MRIIFMTILFCFSCVAFAGSLIGGTMLIISGEPLSGLFVGLLGAFFMLSMSGTLYAQEAGRETTLDAVMEDA